EDKALQLLGRDHANRGVVDRRPGQRVAERAVAVLLTRRRVAERHVRVQRRMLETRSRLARTDDLASDAELGEAPERSLLVGAEVAHRLVEPDETLLDEVVGLTARDEVRAGLETDETGIAAEQCVHRDRVSVPGAEDEP